MSNKIPDKAKENLIKKWIAGADYTELARYLDQFYGVKVHRTTVMRYFKNEVLLTKEDFSDIELDSIDDRVKLDSRIAKYRAEALRYRRLYQLSIKKNLDGTSIIEAIQDAAISFKKVPLQNIPKPKGPIKGQSAQIVVAPLTDTHIGEDVDYQQMAGLNSYSFDIFNKRLFGWATTVLNLVQLRRASVPINELVIPMLGDMTRKPPMKDKYMDWDYLLYQFVAVFCSNQKNIKFDIRTSYMNIFKIFNRNILIMHGDSASGAGSMSTISRVITSLRSVLQYRTGLEPETHKANSEILDPNHMPTTFDSVLMGHFHRVDEIDIGTGHAIICGCMKGGDEFALQRLAVITKPQQIVTYWHEKYGYIGKETIYLNVFDTVDSKFTDVLPEVWADKIETS
jgi:hypothetical protein